MFEFSITKDDFLSPLMTTAGAVEKKHTMPILSNVLIRVEPGKVFLNATDTEIEMAAVIHCDEVKGAGETTVPGKKLIDICRSLSEGTKLTILFKEDKIVIKQGRSRFKLSTLEACDFPNIEDEVKELEFSIERLALINLLQSTHFAMAQQDVRYYLNGLLLEMNQDVLTAVATDGHRLALSQIRVSQSFEPKKIILPRKGIYELLRVLGNCDDEHVAISISSNHCYLSTKQLSFITKLIEGRFPAYNKLIPINNDKELVVKRDALKSTLSRVSILAHEKNRGVLLTVTPCSVMIAANNQDQEEAEENIEADTVGEPIKIGVNATYLLDVLSNIDTPEVKLSFSDPGKSIFIESVGQMVSQYIIMPVKI